MSTRNRPRFGAAVRRRLAAGKDGTETCLGQNFGDLRAFVPLNLDLPVLYGAARAAGLLHRFGQLFLFRQAYADKVLNYGHRLPTTPRLLPDDINPATTLPRRFGFRVRGICGARWQTFGGQNVKGILAKTLPVAGEKGLHFNSDLRFRSRERVERAAMSRRR